MLLVAIIFGSTPLGYYSQLEEQTRKYYVVQ